MSLFGTSGVRGVFEKDLTLDLCRDVAQALATILPVGARVCLATDSRVSGPAIKEAVISGLCTCGVEATDLGMLPTPALALLTREWSLRHRSHDYCIPQPSGVQRHQAVQRGRHGIQPGSGTADRGHLLRQELQKRQSRIHPCRSRNEGELSSGNPEASCPQRESTSDSESW